MAGYNEVLWKSNNAIKAEKRGLRTASQIAKALGVSAQAVKAVLKDAEWHHTSCRYNMTEYYYPPTDGEIQKIKEKEKEIKEQKEKIITFNGKVAYLEWTGTRNHPKAVEKEYIGDITAKGNNVYFDGKRKNLDTKGVKVFNEKGERLIFYNRHFFSEK